MTTQEITERTFTLEAYQHMHEWAGWGYQPARETPEVGRRCALELARAEFVLRNSPDVRVRWEDDDHIDPGDIPMDEYMRSVKEFGNLGCIVERRCEFGYWHDVESLWSIVGDANYRRTVEAELALEAGVCHPLDRRF